MSCESLKLRAECSLFSSFQSLPKKQVGEGLLIKAPVLAFVMAILLSLAAGPEKWNDALGGEGHLNRSGVLCEDAAQNGYSIFPCKQTMDGIYFHYENPYCGNLETFPAYVLATRMFIKAGMAPEISALVISNLFFLGMLILVHNFLNTAGVGRRGLLLLLLIAAFPGSIYFQAASPASMFMFFGLAAFASLIHNRPVLAAAFGFAAGLTMPEGLVLAPVLGLGALANQTERFSTWKTAAVIFGAPIAGSLAGILYMGFEAGKWNAFFLQQSGYWSGALNPFESMTEISRYFGEWGTKGVLFWARVQSLVLGCLVGGALTYFGGKTGEKLDGEEVFFLGWACWFWLTGVCMQPWKDMYTMDFLVLPLVFVLARLPASILGTLIASLAVLKILMTDLLLTGVLT